MTPTRFAPNLVAPFVVLAGPDVIEGDGSLNLESAKYLQAIMTRLQERWPVEFYFKCSYDKANRTSIDSYRGPGLHEGVAILHEIKKEATVRIITDVHTPQEIELAATVADMIQIPAFLSRQTDMLVTAARAGCPINVKKGQFLSPHDVIHCVRKILSTADVPVYVTERGASFGYNNLVVDMRSFPIVQSYGVPIIFDATHSVQLPGGKGTASGGERQYVSVLARAAVAAGCDGLFLETHPNPDQAPCDGPNMIPLDWVENLLETCLQIRHATLSHIQKAPSLEEMAASL